MLEVRHGDCREIMAAMEPASVDAIVTDPPYGLSFMGKGWDHAVPGEDFWREALRVAKPGAFLLAFGGTRQWHRLACAVEDAGWQMRDTLMWMHGQGFPKGKGCLKPAWEPVIMASKKGRSVLQVDACRLGTNAGWTYPNGRGGRGFGGKPSLEKNLDTPMAATSGRWPANVILDEEAAGMLDGQAGERVSGGSPIRRTGMGYHGASVQAVVMARQVASSGGPSRFYYCAKASRSEREAGLDGMPMRRGVGTLQGDADGSLKTGSGNDRNTETRNHHPTVKPLALMRWLVRLVTPPGGLVLDPFVGSGTTGCAAALEGLRFIGCEMEAEYVKIAEARIAHHSKQAVLQDAL